MNRLPGAVQGKDQQQHLGTGSACKFPGPTAALPTQPRGNPGAGGREWEWNLTSPPGDSDASPNLATSALTCKIHEDRISVGPITPRSPVLE